MSIINEIDSFIYDEYYELGPEAYHEKIRFFETHKRRILDLTFEKSLRIQCNYIFALFETEKYFNVLKNIDKLINVIISENIFELEGRDIYKDLLFVKAESLYQILDYHKSHHVISELIKLDSEYLGSKALFLKNRADHFRYEGQKVRTVCIVFFILTAVFIGMEWLFRLQQSSIVENLQSLRNSFFLLALLIYFGQEIRIKTLAKQEYNVLIKTIKIGNN